MRLRTWIVIFAVILLVFATVFFYGNSDKNIAVPVQLKASVAEVEVIGKSVSGRNIEAINIGSGKNRIVFVGGIHGGYEWNSVMLSYRAADYLENNLGIIPSNVSVSIIPNANPDGLFKVIGKEGRFSLDDIPLEKNTSGIGRFNAREVDLNRNFDCKWKPKSTWRGEAVDAGSRAFSEPEAVAIRDFVLKMKPKAVVFWHSQSDAVYGSECENGILPVTEAIMNAYSKASGYQAIKTFDNYEVTGDAEGWLASIDIPAITVELKTHETVEWDKNLSGIKALFEYFK